MDLDTDEIFAGGKLRSISTQTEEPCKLMVFFVSFQMKNKSEICLFFSNEEQD